MAMRIKCAAGKSLLSVVLIASCLSPAKPGIADEPFKPNWESLKQYQCPEWFRDAKFGIYAHWGVYCVPQFFSEWYPHWMYQPGHKVHQFHVENFGPLDEFGYKDFIPMFTAEKFNADQWAELYHKAGAKFAGPVAEHHDGFAMWDSALTTWDAKERGPKRDVVGEMEKAVRKRGMKFAATLHHINNWGWYSTSIEDADVHDPQNSDFYGRDLPVTAFRWGTPGPPDPMPDEAFCTQWLAKTKEVIDKYQPDLLWFDFWLCNLPESYRVEMLSHYYNQAARRNEPVVLAYKPAVGPEELKPGTATIDLETARMANIYPSPWLTDISITRGGWAFSKQISYRPTSSVVHQLVDIVSKNGCMLLNIAPRPDGSIPEEQREILLGIGKWLEVNGEAIYGTRPWVVSGEGPAKTEGGPFVDSSKGFTGKDIRFTAKGNTLYAILLGQPHEPIRIHSLLAEPIIDIRLLGSDQPLEWKHDRDALEITPPATLPCDYAITFCIRLE